LDGNAETLNGLYDGSSNDMSSKACPRAATRLDELDPSRRKPDDRVMRGRSVDTSGREVERTRSARYSEITRIKDN
jgi:hypothetical protein